MPPPTAHALPADKMRKRIDRELAALQNLEHLQDTQYWPRAHAVCGRMFLCAPYDRLVGFVLYLSERHPFEAPRALLFPPLPNSTRSPVFHPNVQQDTGSVCVDLLYDGSRWSPSLTLEAVLTAVQSVIATPGLEHGMNEEALALYKKGGQQAWGVRALKHLAECQRESEAGFADESLASVAASSVAGANIGECEMAKAAGDAQVAMEGGASAGSASPRQHCASASTSRQVLGISSPRNIPERKQTMEEDDDGFVNTGAAGEAASREDSRPGETGHPASGGGPLVHA